MGPARCLVLILGFLAGLGSVAGQRFYALTGTILDPSDSAVPGAVVAVVSEESGFRRNTQSAPDGRYTVPYLEPGNYKITVRKEGFRTLIRFGVAVDGRRPVQVDFSLPVGSMQETVTVEDTAPLLDPRNPSPGTSISRAEIERLPLNGRGLLTLVNLAPGTVITPATRGEPGQFTINGQRPNSHHFTVDGVSANTGVTGGGLPAQPTGGALPAMSAFGSFDSLLSLDSLQEFHIDTTTAAPETGRLPGASVALTSRAGANEYHGSLGWAFRHEWLSANDWFANRAGSGRAPLRLNDGVATFGGPVRRDKTFFFASYEGMRLRQPVAWRTAVPLPLTGAGDSPEWVHRLLGLFPAPNGPALTADLGEWNGRNNRPSHLDAGSLRIDHALTARATLFARLNAAPSASEFGNTQVNRLDLRWRSATLALTLRPAPGIDIDVRGNLSYARGQSSWMQTGPASAPCYLEPAVSALLRVPGGCDYLVRLTVPGLPQVTSGREGRRWQNQMQYVAGAAWNPASHAVRWGADYRRLTPSRRDATASGSIIAESLSDLLAGRNLWTANAAARDASTRLDEFSLYAQDTWQATSRLTATYGLRWELNPAPIARPSAYFLVPSLGGVLPDTRPLWPTEYGNLAPRAALAWRLSPSGQTVVRAGGGVYYDSSLSIATDLINGGPFNLSAYNNPRHAPFSMLLSYGFFPDLRLPRVTQWSGSVERSIGSGQVISASYIGSTGHALIRREMGGPGSNGSVWISLATNHGASSYHGMQLQYRRRLTSGLDAFASYVWSHSIDNSSSDSGLYWAGPGAGLSRERASSDFDVRHTLSVSFSYAMPVLHGPGAKITGRWFIDGVLRGRSGFPVTVLASEQYMGLTFANAFRPDLVPGQPIWLSDPGAAGGRRLNPAAFRVAAEAVQGGLGRNAITGFGMWQVDASVRREFPLRERTAIQVRLEAFNALNRASFADPVRYLASPMFGQSLSMLDLMLGSGSPGSGLAPMFQPGGARTVQFAVKLRF